MGELATMVMGPRHRDALSEYEQKQQFWESYLKLSQPATFPYDKSKASDFSTGLDVQTFSIDDGIFQSLLEFCIEHATDSFSVLFAAFRAAHFRLTGQEDVVIGSQKINHGQNQINKAFHQSTNIKPLRVSIEGESLEDLVKDVQATWVKFVENDAPYETIVSRMKQQDGSSFSPGIRISFTLHSHSHDNLSVLRHTSKDQDFTSTHDLELHIFEDFKSLRGDIIMSRGLYDYTKNQTLLTTFLNVLSNGLQHPKTPIHLLPLLSDNCYSELHTMDLIQLHQTDYARDSSVIDVFRHQVDLYPNRVAARDCSTELTYLELEQRSDILACWLASRSLAPETIVGVFANRSCQTVIAFLGILKANLAYLPLDTRTPIQRIEAILSSLHGHKLVLVGSNLQLLDSQMKNLECVYIEEALLGPTQGSHHQEILQLIEKGPSATSLAYLMFTSGSTGQPKGVMVEHRGVVRLAKEAHIMGYIPRGATMAHMSNLAFDATTWEIYATLLNGGLLFCIDTASLLDYNILNGIFTQEKVQVAFLTTALFKQYVNHCPAILSNLNTVVVGGERLDPQDLFAGLSCMPGKLIHAYGPTENTGFSTIYPVPTSETCPNGVPIGRSLQNSGVLVMDSLQRLVPLGVIGELVLTGDGLARGYTDPQRNIDRFVTVLVGGETIRAYRTGDYARYRPSDGQLEFLGRIDGQIKIRGNRIELAEIEQALQNHCAVNNSIVVPQYDSDKEAHLLAFVTISETETLVQSSEMDVLAGDEDAEDAGIWENLFNADTYNDIRDIQPERIGRDFMGWTSMYDGSQIDKTEMNEWLDDTIQTILNGRPPGNVIELGTGTGMILFNLALAPGFESYVGIDPSKEAVEFVTRTSKVIPPLKEKVKMYKGSAVDIGELKISISPNLAIINSVAQYFPSQEYLLKVIKDLTQLEGMRTIFCGDIRSYPLYQQFQVTKSFYMLGEAPSMEQLRQHLMERECIELELLVDPSFFTSLSSRLPHVVEHVEILPKRMKATNELSCYRYAAVIHLKGQNLPTQEIHEVPGTLWINFVESKLNSDMLLELLQNSSDKSIVAVSNIPHSKTVLERHVLDALYQTNNDHGQGNWLENVRERAKHCPSFSALDLEEHAMLAGYRVEISWARQYSQLGGLDAIFHKLESDNSNARVMFRFPTDDWAIRSNSLSTSPWKQQLKERVHEELFQSLRAKLPSYMVPQTISIVSKIPLNDNGKVDRRALIEKARSLQVTQASTRQPETKTERLLQTIWASILNIDRYTISLDDNFFHLGGSSIAAMKVVSQARKVGLELVVAEIFSHPKLQDLCQRFHQVNEPVKEFAPFALLQENCDISSFIQDVASQYQIDASAIEDAYPCTPLQEGLISLTSKHSGDYVLQVKIELSSHIQIDMFCGAWETVVRQLPILRTRIAHHKSMGMLQLVLNEDIRWVNATTLDKYLETDRTYQMSLGQPLTRYALVSDEEGQNRNFVWTVHHALFDGWSMRLIMDAVRQTYLGNPVEKVPQFQSFINHIPDLSDDKMASYWRESLSHCESVPFPMTSSSAKEQPKADQVIEYSMPKIKQSALGITTSSLIRAAWALVAGRMTNSSDVLFGVLQSGRNAPIIDIDKMACPTIATVPLRIKYSKDQKVSDYLDAVQRQSTEMIPFEQSGLHRIAKLSPETRNACMFQTMLVIQPQEIHQEQDAIGKWEYHNQTHWFNTYALLMEVQLGSADITITASFDSAIIKSCVVSNLLKQLEHTINQLNTIDTERNLSQIQTMTPQDLQQIWQWNSKVPKPVHDKIHSMFERFVQSQPDRPAVCAWDGDLTYSELDSLATSLASHLQRLNFTPNYIIPLCFEKSKWVTVSILGVLKAGYGFVLLDPFVPEERLRRIASQVKSNLILSSVSTRDLSSRVGHNIVTICSDFFERVESGALGIANSNSESIAYVVFTSGSTGDPKGITITHTNYSSALHHQASAFMYSPESRVLDFSSHSFDATILNTFTVLNSGGCLCIPNDNDRMNNLTASFVSLRANSALITPSIGQLLSPENVPELKTIIFGGEACRIQDVLPWWGKVRVVNAYGPSECTPASIINHKASSPWEVTMIGKGMGQVTWVVDPDDHEILLPPGCIGELLLEGPLIGQGYLNEPEKTAAAFIKDPSWLLRGGPSHPGRHGRLYKTGDLVQYHEDGSLSYIGRKDAQIKIRGQRVELEEIEHRVRECITNATKVVVEVVFPQGRESSPVVVAFLQLPKQALENTDSEYPNGRLRDISPEVKDSLSKHLPSYMLPRFFISMDRIPINTSGKLNRKLMRDIGGSILTQRLAESQRLVTSKKRPTSDAEQILQLVWSEVLKVETASIGIDDNFFQLGGDSVDAMRVVSDAYHAGLSITVASIFHHPKLSDLAQTGTQVLNGKDKKIQPFALLGNSCDTNFLIQEIASQYQLEMRKIQDLYPCTPLQEGLLSMTLKRPGEFVNQSILKLSSDLSLEEFRRAWEEVVQQIPILRTTIVHHNDFGLLQAVLDTGVEWIIEDSLEQYIQCDRSTVMGLGQPLVRYALIENDGGVWFVWTIHHALYDGWSMPLILDAVTRSYHGQSLGSMAHIQEFVRHIHSQDMTKATEYWTHELAGCEAVSFPSVPASIETPKANAMVEHCSPLLKERSSSTTISTLIRAAWGVAASRMTHSRDVVFGATMSGRSLPVPGIDRMIVPTITTVPIRITLSDDQQVSKYLSAVQKQATEMIPFEQSGLHRIGKMSLDAQRACTFQTLLVVQPYEEQKRTVKPGLGKWQEVNQQEWFDTYALVIEACPRADGVSFTASFDSTVIDSWAVKRLLQRLELVAHQLDTAPGHHTMANIKFTTASDLADIWRWNSTVPEPSQQYVHQMIEEQAKSRPNSPAVCAWDGELTYLELISLSSKLANRLVTIGISAGMLVPLCFEKSMWTSIAMVAVLRAGGAFVLLDASLPEQRLQVIVKQSNARLIVSSYQNRALSARLCPETLIVDSNSLAHLDSQHHQSSIPGLSSTAYAIFTSGTTGTPKGAVITHQNISSAIGHQIGLYEYGPESRVFDFSSYSFDPSIFSALSVFTSGGCLCVPSDQDRQTRLADSISSLRANTLDLTPTIARFLRPSNVPGVHTIILSGEMVHIKDVEPWWPKVRVLNLYGPSECTITSTMNTTASSPEEVLNIGRGAGLLTWIVDPDDHNCLLPPGCTGELILEGPLVGNGYLNDPERTAAAFIKPPKWLIEGTPGESERHARRVYKTGDIVQYNKDGSLKILGRKDTQVKLRGQRVELAEVENGVRSCIPDVKWVIADVIPPRGSNGSPALVAFVQFHKIRADDAEVTLIPIVPDVQSKLNELLPSYMVPVAVFSIKQIPLTTAGKTDRPRLRELGGQMSIGSSGEIAYGSKPSLESNANERYILDTEETAYALAEKISSMCALWAQVSLGCNGDTTPNKARKYQDVPLHSCGLDSVSVMSLMYYLSQSFHVNVSLKLLMSRETTIRGLARIVSSLQASGLNGSLAHTPTPEPETVHLITEVNKLDSKIADLQRSSVECGDGSLSLNNKPLVVLLTGSTGFIGTQILRQLLEHGQVDTVIALVRSETADSARGRIIDAARKALWWTEFHADKLFVWQGDLALPRLGLDPAHYSTLSESNSIDIIIHNGAVVHWGKGYRDLETVNVSSTVTLLQHAVTKPHMRFVYVTGGLQWADGESEELVAQELSLEHTNGYSQTKFVSEAVVRRAALRDKSRPGHLGIVSPGLVIGTSTEGVANSDDYIWRLALACIRLRAYNADMASTWLPVSDAAAMASDIVNAALQPSKTVTCATGGMIWADFWAILEYMGYTLKPTSGKEWLAAIRADIELEREAHPLWPLAHMIESQNTRKEHEDVFDDLHRKNTPIRLKVAVMRNVEFLARVGFLPPITGSRHSPNLDQHLGSFSRSGIYV